MAFIDDTNKGNGYILKVAGLKEGKVHFDVFSFGDFDTKVRETKGIAGKFRGVASKEIEFEKNGKKRKMTIYKIHLHDKDEHYIIDSSANSVVRAFLNILAQVKLNEEISISLYTNKKGFPSVGIKRGEEDLKRTLDFDKQKAMIKTVEANGDKINDYRELETYLFDKCEKYVKATIDVEDDTPADKVEIDDTLPF